MGRVTDRLPGMVEAFAALPTRMAILDGELYLIDPRGAAHFYRLMAQMRTGAPDESQLMFWSSIYRIRMASTCVGCRYRRTRSASALHQIEGAVYVRGADVSEWGAAICSLRQVPIRRPGEQTPVIALHERAEPKLDQIECPNWKRANAERNRLFEGPRKPELTEAQKTLAKKREELGRGARAPRSPSLRQGIARELRKHVAILEREIAELTKT